MNRFFCSLMGSLFFGAALAGPAAAPTSLSREKSDAARVAQEMTAEAAAPYLGLYWNARLPWPMIVVLHQGRLAIEIPSRTLRELEKTTEDNLWSYVDNPENLVKFHREGTAPVTAMELRERRTETVPRFEPEKDLPSLEELFARRPDPRRTEQLGALGTLRMSGSIERTTSPEKGSFELLSAGDEHSRLKLNLGGAEIQLVVAGKQAWSWRQASSQVEEMPEAAARSARLAGWLLATGDWRHEFKQARVLKRVELAGEAVFLVHAAPESGRQRLIYLDATTGLIRGYDEVAEIRGVGWVGCETRFADYRDIAGVRIPFKITAKYSTPRLGTWTFQVDKVETAPKLGADPFAIK